MDRGAWWATVHGAPRVRHDLATKRNEWYSQHIELNKCLLNFKAWDNEKQKEKTPHNITNTNSQGFGPSLAAQMVKNLPAVKETWVWSLGWEDPLEEGMATHSSTLAWRIPWTEEPGGLQSTGSQRVRHNWVTKPSAAHQGLPGGSVVMNQPAVQEMEVQLLSLDHALEKHIATNFSILAWKIP